ncbi:MAG: hypothetical protein A2231_07210 [Candidatus Firestonebacteria bacterium RIFOXYA2_FULL_40_8]|nr:MAG: hypothetical protein A2231_07210 [Candidatus Firestonebacteria bacterium RIFOXYA2_FULL_40_8]HLD31823.1 signal peptidase II [Patescibacteria group bacterium]
MKEKVRLTLYGVASGLFLIIDQVIKQWCRHSGWQWREGGLGFGYWENTGIAFSLPFPNWLLLVLTPIVILLLAFLLFHQPRYPWAIMLVITGATSNLVDRFLYSITIDYLHFFTSIFNLADVLIIGGGLFLLFGLYQPKKKES